MVNLGLLIAGAVLAGVVFFRREIGEAGSLIGRGFGEFGTGIRTGVSAITSPSIRPEFVPTVGLKIEGPGNCESKNCFHPGLFQPCPSTHTEDFFCGCCPKDTTAQTGSGIKGP